MSCKVETREFLRTPASKRKAFADDDHSSKDQKKESEEIIA